LPSCLLSRYARRSDATALQSESLSFFVVKSSNTADVRFMLHLILSFFFPASLDCEARDPCISPEIYPGVYYQRIFRETIEQYIRKCASRSIARLKEHRVTKIIIFFSLGSHL
jgi:hypothetical protein